jgi:hypothetical protein
MDFVTLSIPESLYLYMGLAVQAIVRASTLWKVPGSMVLLWAIVLLWRAPGRAGGYKSVLGYVGTSLILLIAFWPEAVPYGRLTTSSTAATQVASYAASQDEGAEVVTAEDTAQVPEAFHQPAPIPVGTRLLLRIVTELPLGLGRAINTHAHRTFAHLMPMSWFLEVKLPAQMQAAVADFTHGCYLPTLLETLNGQPGLTAEDLLPFGSAPLRTALAARSVTPGAHTGITWLSGPNAGNVTPCDVYLAALEFQAQTWLAELKSPKGTPYLELFAQELGMAPQAQGAMLLYREMLHAVGPGVPAPSLAAQYAKLQSVGVLGNALGGAAQGAAVGGWAGAGWGLLTGGVNGLLGNFQQSLEGLSWLVRVAMVLTWYFPYLLGIANLVLIGLFPIVLLWALIPGTQFQPLAQYWVALLFTSSAPLWFALIDQVTTLGSTQPPAVDGLMGTAWQAFVASGLWGASLTALGLLLVPVIVGLLYFAAFRAVGSLWKGGVA